MAPPAVVTRSAESARLTDYIKKVVVTIKKIIQECNDANGGHMQPAVDRIVAVALECGAAYRKNILGRNCGIHPENRAKTGVDPCNAQNLTLKISLQGYSESKLENPMGFEKAAAGTAASAQEAFMARNFNLANGFLKKIPFHDVEYLPVTCSHTFAALNIIEAGNQCLGLHDKLATDGKIDQAKALKLCPSWKKPMTEGIP